MNTLICILIFILGLCAGSFVNVVIYRLPRRESVVWPPSHCPACSARLAPCDLLPLISYIALAGRCRYCTQKIAVRYPLVELACGLLFLAAAYRFGRSLTAFSLWFLLSLLLAISLIDLEHQRIPNLLVGVGMAAGVIFRLWGMLVSGLRFPVGGWLDALWGLLASGGLMLIIFLASRGGMGGGDVKLAALLGFWLGFKGAVITMILGFVSGALLGVVLILLGLRRRRDLLPFAPFLNTGALITVFWGSALAEWYFKLIGW
ncbi:MAG TPA: prepilin peptidase [Firmicutes bacterium]|nr:prepilin peptidase [Bacillota bacterium]